jgi:hypothetical protein
MWEVATQNGARASPGCELCERARNMDLKTTDVLPTEKVGHIQSAGCKSQQKSVIGAYKQLWTETRIGNMMMMSFICSFRNNNHKPWDEIADEEERLLASDQAN